MAIKVLIEAKKIRNLNVGLGQFLLHFGLALLNVNDSRLKLRFYLPSNKKGVLGKKKVKYKTARGLYLQHPGLLGHYDVFHMTSPLWRYKLDRIKGRLLLTIHDLNYLYDNNTAEKISEMSEKMQNLLDRADTVVCSSHFTKQCVEQSLQVEGKRIEVIHLGLALDEMASPKKPAQLIANQFLFAIGGTQPKKNFHVLVGLLKVLPNISLVIAGPDTCSEYKAKIINEAEKYGVTERVIFLGKVSEGEKKWLYQHCYAFTFPSISEGFGLPVLEAMTYGKPVFLSKMTSLPEIGGAEAYYWDNFDYGDMCKTFVSGMESYQADKDKPSREKSWAAKFSWKDTATQYLEIYCQMAGLSEQG